MSSSAFELLHARPGHAEELRDLAVAHGLAHLPDGLARDACVLGRQSLCLGLGCLGSGDPLGRVDDLPDVLGGSHATTV